MTKKVVVVDGGDDDGTDDGGVVRSRAAELRAHHKTSSRTGLAQRKTLGWRVSRTGA